jgi:hypothetical protein
MPNPADRFARWGSRASGRKGGAKGATRISAGAKRATPEADFQGAVVSYFNYALPKGIEWTATLSGAHLGENQRMMAKRTGLRRGISDFVLVAPARGAFFMEVKPPRGQRSGAGGHRQYRGLTDDQERWAAALGKRWQTCHTLEEVEAALILWGIEPRCSIVQANRYAMQASPEPDPELDL